MKNNYLFTIAKEVLQNEPNGLSKVRFAKILYFVHKGLITAHLSEVTELKFIRMPLGPVPVGFMELSEDSDILISESQTNSSLLYNTQVYTLNIYNSLLSEEHKTETRNILDNLKRFSTSKLVEISHQEPSWIHLSNGQEYYISEEDLKTSFPSVSKNNMKNISKEMDDQRLQARLVEGMLDDIVDESTALEYPF